MRKITSLLILTVFIFACDRCSVSDKIGGALQSKSKKKSLAMLSQMLALTNSAEPSAIYIAGGCRSGSIQCTGYWKNGVWNSLAPLDGSIGNFSGAMTVSGSDIYVGGYAIDKSYRQVPGYWKNRMWVSLPPINSSQYSFAVKVILSGTDIYVTGSNMYSSFIPGYWKNGVWVTLPALDITKMSAVLSLTLAGGDVYAGGFSVNSSNLIIEGYWKNGVWNGFNSRTSKYLGFGSLLLSGTDIYVSNGGDRAGYWKNGIWNSLVSLDDNKESAVYSMAISEGEVYAGGYSSDSTGKPVAGYWKNGTWNLLYKDGNSMVSSLSVYGFAVYAAGYISNSSVSGYSSNASYFPGYWKNGIWNSLTPPDKNTEMGYSLTIIP